MAYTNEQNAGYRSTGFTHGAAAFLGRIRALIEKLIVRERIEADDNNVPIGRPVDEIDARATIEFLDQSGAVAHTAAAANITSSYREVDGSTTASVIIGAMVAGSVRHDHSRKRGGFGNQQEFELEGALTYTPTA